VRVPSCVKCASQESTARQEAKCARIAMPESSQPPPAAGDAPHVAQGHSVG
jgi:hypothetical protein